MNQKFYIKIMFTLKNDVFSEITNLQKHLFVPIF